MLKTTECTTTQQRPDVAFVDDKVYGKVNLENTNTRYLYTKRGEPQFKGGQLFTEEVPVMAREQIERTDVDVYVSEVPVKVVEAKNILPATLPQQSIFSQQPFSSQQQSVAGAVDLEAVSVGSYRPVMGGVAGTETKCVEYVSSDTSPHEKIFSQMRFGGNTKPSASTDNMYGNKRVKVYKTATTRGYSGAYRPARYEMIEEEIVPQQQHSKCKTDCLHCTKSENEFHCDLMRYETDADKCHKMCKKSHKQWQQQQEHKDEQESEEEEVVVGEILYPESVSGCDSCSEEDHHHLTDEIVIESEEEEDFEQLPYAKYYGKSSSSSNGKGKKVVSSYKIVKPKSRVVKRKAVVMAKPPAKKRYALKKVRIQ